MRTNRQRPRSTFALAAASTLIFGLLAAPSCGDDGGDGPEENTGDDCAVPDDCYRGVPHEELQGEVQCLDRVEGGYCTHFCATDADCCAVEGECDTGHPQVCGPFESTGMMFCFLSCEDTVLNGDDPDNYCNTFAHFGFGCRSTGGGSENRKVCVP